jgi:hypothetical protein
MPPGATDTASEVFTARLASLLHTARADRGTSLREMARATEGAATGRQLRAIEAAEADLTRFDVAAIASAYGLDPSSLVGDRVPIDVDLDAGVLRSEGTARHFTPGATDGLLTAYLQLVRDVRHVPEGSAVPVRRADVEVLAWHLGADAASVLDRLAALMGATGTERRSLDALFAAGAAVLVLTAGAVAMQGPGRASSDNGSNRDARRSTDAQRAPDARRPSAAPLSAMTPPPPPPEATRVPTTGGSTIPKKTWWKGQRLGSGNEQAAAQG